jgi:hypothetical protein
MSEQIKLVGRAIPVKQVGPQLRRANHGRMGLVGVLLRGRSQGSSWDDAFGSAVVS